MTEPSNREESAKVFGGGRGAVPSRTFGRLLGIPVVPHLVAALCVLSLLLVTSWLWIEMQQRFPHLPQGSYYGRITGLFPDAARGGAPFFVESTSSNEFFLVILHGQWQPQRSTMVPRGNDVDDSEWLHPVVVIGDGQRLKFTGKRNGAEFTGTVFEQDGRRRGRWRLARIPTRPAHDGGFDAKEIEVWLRLKAELGEIEAETRKAEQRVPEQQKEIEKLTAFITEGDSLRTRAEKKYQEVTRELQSASDALHEQEKRALALEEKLTLAQTVTDMGRLVSLSRQTLERENRWIDSVLGTELPPVGADFQEALARAKKIAGVKRAIAEEEEYIRHLEGLMQQGKSAAAPQSFESIWGN